MDYRQDLVQNADICGGKMVFKGTGVRLRTILASVVEGASVEEILTDFPTLTS